MEKLLRILFVMCAIAFVTTATACADDKTAKTGGNDKTAKTGGNDKTAKTGGDYKTVKTGGDDKTANAGGNDKTANTGGNDKTANAGGDANTAKTPSIFKFEVADAGVTIDKSKDVYKITINPSLLTYVVPWGTGFEASAFMPIFTVTFTDDKQGFIIPTTVDKAEDLKTTYASDQETALDTNFNQMANANDITHSFLADPDANYPVFGFDATELNADWSTLAPRAAVTGIMTDTRVRVGCSTTITGTKAASFTVIAPADDDDLAIAKGTKTECKFSLVGIGTDDEKTAAYKAWATAAVAAAKDDATKNIQKMGFVGIVTGDDTASEITKAAGITEDANTLGVIGFTADASAKLVKAYKISFQKVEIVIAVAK